MSIKESALAAITSIAQGDFVRAVTSAGASRRVTVANLAKAIVESYTGSSLAGSNQSVKSALDSLNSKTSVTPEIFQSRVTTNFVYCFRMGNVVHVNIRCTANQALTGNTVFTGLPAPSRMQYLNVSKSNATAEIRNTAEDGIVIGGVSSGETINISGSYVV